MRHLLLSLCVCLAVVYKSNHRFLIGGNWKANGSPASVGQLIEGLNQAPAFRSKLDVVCSPPALYLGQVKQGLKADFLVAAQNLLGAPPGAFTGELPVEILQNFGIQWAIVGHSERRQHCAETNKIVGQKVAFATSRKMNVIACVGESAADREAGRTFDVVNAQLEAIFSQMGDHWEYVNLAYEPVWAIGTGLVATPQEVAQMHSFIHEWLTRHLGTHQVRIIYGGSVNPENAPTLAKIEHVDGFLIGGVSLKADQFVQIIRQNL